jgi:hypothetical protein
MEDRIVCGFMRVSGVETMTGAGNNSGVEGCGAGESGRRSSKKIWVSPLNGGAVVAVATTEGQISIYINSNISYYNLIWLI